MQHHGDGLKLLQGSMNLTHRTRPESTDNGNQIPEYKRLNEWVWHKLQKPHWEMEIAKELGSVVNEITSN